MKPKEILKDILAGVLIFAGVVFVGVLFGVEPANIFGFLYGAFATIFILHYFRQGQ